VIDWFLVVRNAIWMIAAAAFLAAWSYLRWKRLRRD